MNVNSFSICSSQPALEARRRAAMARVYKLIIRLSRNTTASPINPLAGSTDEAGEKEEEQSSSPVRIISPLGSELVQSGVANG